jgi:hypothetical protein
MGAAAGVHGGARAQRRRERRETGRERDPVLAVTRFPRKDVPYGERQTIGWRNVLDYVARPRISAKQKEDLTLWSFATFRGNHRGAEDVEEVFSLGFDDDERPLPWGEASPLWTSLGVRGILHTTASHRPDAPRYRVFLLLSRPVSGDEYRLLWRAIERLLEALGHKVGQAAKDPSRAWFVPAAVHGGEYLFHELNGRPLDVDAVLAEERARQEAELAEAEERARAAHKRASPAGDGGTGGRPGDDYAVRTSWAHVLGQGWVEVYRRGDVAYWRRPGKTEGVSATTNYAGTDLFYVFTSSAPPFEPNRSYNKFAAFAVLNHGADFAEAARELAASGYGSKSASTAGAQVAEDDAERLILDPTNPLPSARKFTDRNYRVREILALRHQGGVFYAHQAETSAYHDRDEASVRAELYGFLEPVERWQAAGLQARQEEGRERTRCFTSDVQPSHLSLSAVLSPRRPGSGPLRHRRLQEWAPAHPHS